MIKIIVSIAVGIVILIFVIFYLKWIKKDYEKRLMRLYQDIYDDCLELKSYMRFDKASRETNINGKLNEMFCKYARNYRNEQNKSFVDIIKNAIKKN